MTNLNKPHPKISRAALMLGIADMEAMKPKEKVELTQKEAVEIAAEAVKKLMGKGYSLAEVIEMMKESFGLTLNAATVRSYLRQVKTANDVAAEQKPISRRGRKAKTLIVAEDASKINDEAAGDKMAHDSAVAGEEMQIENACAREVVAEVSDASAQNDAQDDGEVPDIEDNVERDEIYEMVHGEPNPNLKGRG